MQIRRDGLKKIILTFMDQLEILEKELHAHKALAHLLKEQHPDVDETLEVLRGSPWAKDHFSEKYREARSRFSTMIDRVQTDQDLDEFLRTWKPSGEPN